MFSQRRLRRLGGSDGPVSRGERNKERVALGAHLDALMCLPHRPQQHVMLLEQLAIDIAQLMEHPRRSLDVREQQRHPPGGEGGGLDDRIHGHIVPARSDQQHRVFDAGADAAPVVGRCYGIVIVPGGTGVRFRRQGWLRSVSQAGSGASAWPALRFPSTIADGCWASA